MSGSTVDELRTDEPCVNEGDLVDLNDDGGYVENRYRSGVPYEVLGAVHGSVADSFIRGDGTGNGSVFSTSDTTSMDGFASNENEELMLQATLATGPDATPLCPGGTRGVHAYVPPPPPSTPVKVGPDRPTASTTRASCQSRSSAAWRHPAAAWPN